MFDKIKDMNNSSKPSSAASPAPAPAPYRAPPSAQEDGGTITSISAGVTVTGKITGEGTVKVFGRVEGEINASNVLICADAHVEGNINAQDLTVGGRIKGTMQAQRVKLLGTANVEGDIFHQSLTIEENARFEGSSRRKENVSDKPVTTPAKPQISANPPQTISADNAPARVVQPMSMVRASEG